MAFWVTLEDTYIRILASKGAGGYARLGERIFADLISPGLIHLDSTDYSTSSSRSREIGMKSSRAFIRCFCLVFDGLALCENFNE
jgi:hypothetical protein